MQNLKMHALILLALLMMFMFGWNTVSGNTRAGKTDPQVINVLTEIENKQKSITTLQIDFVQLKKLAVFDQELVIKGTIALQKPGRLAWRVEDPLKYNMVIKGETLRQWDEGSNQVQTLSLSNNPMFGAMIHQMNAWFSGKYSSMVDQYIISMVSAAPVILHFFPRDTEPMFNVIEKVAIEFLNDNTQIHRISILDKTGDQTTLTFIDPRINGEIDPKLWKVQP